MSSNNTKSPKFKHVLVDRCLKSLRSGPLSAIQLAARLGVLAQSVTNAMKNHPELFELRDPTARHQTWQIRDIKNAER